ncbi:MAG: dienelactone hydrolase family protein [Candidatus Omnitrophica bacterium]|nr:dienelactone hydrolase family protein [Candidatus Omnitrophota bacterium]
MKRIIALLFLLSATIPAFAAVQTKTFEYKDGDTVLEGYVAYDDAVAGKRPGVLVVHDWMGFGPFANQKAEELAKLGYTALAVDIYGKGVRPKNTDEAGAQATIYKSDRALLRKRIIAGYEALKSEATVDVNKIAVMGFCFGGTTSLELARSGAPIVGVVSFHGGLNTPTPMDAKNIKAKVLALHGADDPYVPAAEVDAFEKEMNDGKVDWQLVKYSGAVHAFTNPAAGNDNSKGAAYNANADKRSWTAMKSFFEEVFK